MGTGIAVANLRQGIRVKLYDASPEALDRAHGDAARRSSARLRTAPAITIRWLQICSTHEQLADCDLLIETVAENRELKQRVFRQLAPHLASHALFATNTSTIRLAELSTAVPDARRFCGLHFCNPVTDAAAGGDRAGRADERGDHRGAGRVRDPHRQACRSSSATAPVSWSIDCCLPYLNEALEMVCQGVDLAAIDRAGRAFGMALGPFEMLDMIGVDTAMRAGRTLWEAYPEPHGAHSGPAQTRQARPTGPQTGRGFYRYPTPDVRACPTRTLAAILAPYIRAHGAAATRTRSPRADPADAAGGHTRAGGASRRAPQRRRLGGCCSDWRFPPRAAACCIGPIAWARPGYWRCCDRWQALGRGMQPTALLRSLAASGGRFYR